IAYLALIALFVAAVNSFLGLASKRTFKSSDKRIGLFGLIFTHIQLLAGLILYFVSQKGFSMLTSGNAMGNSELRLTALEHPIINIIAIVLITIDRKSTRLNSSHVKISYAVFCLKNK